MPVTSYLDFELAIAPTPDGYRARVGRAPSDEAQAPFTLPFTAQELSDFLAHMVALRGSESAAGGASDLQLAQAFGDKLFTALFTGPVYHALRASLKAAAQRSAGLRIRLQLSEAPELAVVPWEFLYDAENGRFMALSGGTPIVRRLAVPTQQTPPAVVALPMRILVLIASPAGLPPLNVAQEWANLNAALGDLQGQGRVVLERLDPPTLPALQHALRRNEYHVFHFVGHGGFDSASQTGLLFLEDDNGRPDAVAGDRLGTMLHDARGLRLALLNACEGGRTAGADPFAGVAQSLIQQGIPAVIAMQFAISDDAAIRNAHEFYLALADGLPVDAALTEARKAVYGRGLGAEWATPVLYLCGPDGRIFDFGRPSEDWRWLAGPGAKSVDWFVNREKQRLGFMKMLARQTPKQIMLVEAPQDMGKTWLLQRLFHECRSQGTPVALIDFRDRRGWDYLAIVREIRDQLGPAAFNRLTQAINEATGLPARRDETAGEGTIVRDRFSFVQADSDVARRAIEARITDEFLACLAEFQQQQVVALLFDTYDQATAEADRWLTSFLLARIRTGLLPRTIIVLAGRTVPHYDDSWRDYLAWTDLALFNREHVAEYLIQKRGLTDVDVQLLFAASNGMPAFLGMMADNLVAARASAKDDEWL